ncbi:MAG: hypothetical protein II567_07670 [Candidatus Riflebacteria bacterium]|nr:hypothetical protein [Candidatus Riflebacteria bacterium]
MMDSHEIAYLSHKGKYTAFKFNDLIIRFLTSSRLNKYLNIKKWNNGYIEVMADFQKVGIVEDYIDLRPILDNLNIDKKLFLTPIKEVQIKYDEC